VSVLSKHLQIAVSW